MEVKQFQTFGLIISCIFILFSCNKKDDFFYKIQSNDDCMIACSVVHSNKESITIVMEKFDIEYSFNKFNQILNDKILVQSIKNKNPIQVSEELYMEFFAKQVINQPRIDSLLELGIDKFFFYNHNNEKLLKYPLLINETYMEELYTIKVLFDNKILLKRDCESGYYYEIVSF